MSPKPAGARLRLSQPDFVVYLVEARGGSSFQFWKGRFSLGIGACNGRTY
jgi:hypothetical protein